MFNFESEKININSSEVDKVILKKFEDYKNGQIGFDDFFREMQEYKKFIFESGSKRQREFFNQIASEFLGEEEKRKSRARQGGVA